MQCKFNYQCLKSGFNVLGNLFVPWWYKTKEETKPVHSLLFGSFAKWSLEFRSFLGLERLIK